MLDFPTVPRLHRLMYCICMSCGSKARSWEGSTVVAYTTVRRKRDIHRHTHPPLHRHIYQPSSIGHGPFYIRHFPETDGGIELKMFLAVDSVSTAAINRENRASLSSKIFHKKGYNLATCSILLIMHRFKRGRIKPTTPYNPF